MKYEKYLLIKLAEEAAEVAQAAIKCSLFGYEQKDPRETDGETNLVKLQKELMDLASVMEELSSVSEGFNKEPDFNADEYITGKKKKLNYYYGVISTQVG